MIRIYSENELLKVSKQVSRREGKGPAYFNLGRTVYLSAWVVVVLFLVHHHV